MTALPRLLVAAHGTESAAGAATTADLVARVAAALPGVDVAACFLDSIRGTVRPTLAEALDAAPGPAVVVPLLLSTGYHVQTDIPAVISGRPGVRVTPHLGPDPLVVTALADRLAALPGRPAASVALVGVGSSRPEARVELATAAERLAARLGRPVRAHTLFDDVRAALAGPPAPAVAPYLLAPGTFHDRLRAAAEGLGPVAEPIGAHAAVVELVQRRYTAAIAGDRTAGRVG